MDASLCYLLINGHSTRLCVGICSSVEELAAACSGIYYLDSRNKSFLVDFFDSNSNQIGLSVPMTQPFRPPTNCLYCHYFYRVAVAVDADIGKSKIPVPTVYYSSKHGYDTFVSHCYAGHKKVNDEYQISIRSYGVNNKYIYTECSASDFGLDGYIDFLIFTRKRSSYSTLTEDMVAARVDFMHRIPGEKRKFDVLYFNEVSQDDHQVGINNLYYFSRICKNYYSSKHPDLWNSAIDAALGFFQIISDTIKPATTYKQIPRRIITDQMVVRVVHFLNSRPGKTVHYKYACEEWLYDQNTEPKTTIGWGPRDYQVERAVVHIPDERLTEDLDYSESDDTVAGVGAAAFGGSSSSLGTGNPSASLNHSDVLEIKQKEDYIATALAQNLGQGIDIAEKEANEKNAIFPIKTMCLLSTGQRCMVHSVNIREKGATPEVGFHGITRLRVLPNLGDFDVHRCDNLLPGQKVSKKEVEQMFAAMLVCFTGVIDLVKRTSPFSDITVNSTEEDLLFERIP